MNLFHPAFLNSAGNGKLFTELNLQHFNLKDVILCFRLFSFSFIVSHSSVFKTQVEFSEIPAVCWH